MTRALWTAEDASAATHGTGPGGWAATGVSIDSRTVQPGDLFIALQGPNFDGHDFVAGALAAGAAAAMVHRDIPGLPADAPLLRVADTFAALQDLGRVARLRGRARVVAVTGSVGKTTTKEMLRLALGAQGATHAAVGSFNNHWGVPLTLARMPEDSRYAVFEVGMNHAGEIAELTRQVRPDVAIVTTVDAVHLGHFSSVEAIADAKAEIVLGQDSAGTAILPRDNPHFPRLLAAARTQGVGTVRSFGAAEGDARLLGVEPDEDGSRVRAEVLGRTVEYRLPLPGRHHALNSLAALLAVAAAGADVQAAADALAGMAPLKGRGLRRRLNLPGGQVLLIDESYNASPVAVAAALTVLGQAPVGQAGRRIAVLGDMLELGRDTVSLHRGLSKPFSEAGIDLLFACGPAMRALYDAVPPGNRGAHAPDSAALAPLVAAALRPGDAVMVKGSLGSRMAQVVAALDGLDTTGATVPPTRSS
ncbi:MAG TPA: UDP-N-acetylmuramoylalanyl-D-glutamyl-2,6-diaminopimelate--D-alanyl-D-alanine ligase [Alphaproteobacteria bacterium]|nr:UDP-N-acetylmuramoylalanyl-D-glutamyl-2,6-diaminopimelate--D-alanyl-D-alanine ligase [Alphaproteobacteria bacterium]